MDSKSPQISDYSFDTGNGLTAEPCNSVRPMRLHPYIFLRWGDSKVVLPAIFFTATSAAVPTGLTILFGRIFDKLARYQKGSYASSDEFVNDLALACFSITLMGVGASISSWIQLSCWMRIGELQQSRARQLLLDSLLKRPMAFFEEGDLNGDLVQVNRCIEELRKATSECSAIILLSILSILSLTVTSFRYSWSLTLVTLSSLPLIAVCAVVFGNLYQKYSRMENENSALVSKIIDWSVVSPIILKSFNSQNDEMKKFDVGAGKCRGAFLKASMYMSMNLAVLRTLGLLMFVQAFWFGSTMVRKGKISSGSVMSCFYACVSIIETLHSLTGQLAVFQKARISLEKIVGFIGTQEIFPTNSLPSNIDLLVYPEIKPKGRIIFNNISFAYPARRSLQVLHNISITIAEGKVTYIVGKSGSGKSTLGSLLLALYKPDTGKITVDGTDVSAVDPRWLTDNITLVQQDGILFSGSIRENILLGIKANYWDRSEPLLNSVIDSCRLKEMVDGLPDAVNTKIGTGGVSLSGGQKQKVALARAMLRDSPILILDESVSALDIYQREALILEVKRWRVGRTTIILTHEYSTISWRDFVCLMENGQVLEMGTKFDLMRQRGKFAELCHKRFLSTSADPGFVFVDKQLMKETFSQRPQRQFTKSQSHVSRLLLSTVDFNEFGTSIGQAVQPDVEAQIEPASLATNDPVQPLGLWRIIRGLRSHLTSPFSLFFGIFCAVVNGGSNPAFSYCFARLISGILPTGGDVGSSSFLVKWSLIVSGIAVLDGATTFGKRYLLAYSSEAWIKSIRLVSFGNLLKQETSWYEKETNKAAEVSALLMNDSRDLRVLIGEFPGILASFTIILSVSVLWSLVCGWKLTLVAIAFIPLFILTAGLYTIMLQKSEQCYKNQVVEIENQLHEVVEGIATVKCLDLGSHFSKTSLDGIAKLVRRGNIRAFQTGFGISISGLTLYASHGVLLFYGLKLFVIKQYTILQTMEVFSLMIFGLVTAVRAISQIPDISRAKRAGTHLLALTQLKPSRTEVSGYAKPSIAVNQGQNLIRFENLTFAYPTRPNIKALKNLSLSIDQGETVAIVGASGSGKSTIVSLVSRLYEAPDEHLLFSGFDINAIQVKYLRELIAFVPQKAVFFNGSIRDNIVYGLPERLTCYDSDIYAVLEVVDMREFVQSLPDRLDTAVGDSVHTLISGGQAQRLSIARALLRRPRLLIMDECTASLDPANTQRIAHFVETCLKRRADITTIMVTHSREIMKVASRVVVIKDGQMVEEGTYDGLMNTDGELDRIANTE
ncbi:unnamed protein product [Kuraishia capsulata CBS 1993]|uniref:Uncharacterized protein n=1 Tax=Kuraishia capsulata CBS 1993 TaxID=1382522 RepID=W6MKJ8_9ASCO|nr:uncharacterized protein KUCA_T00002480001 [Kuraishia capsulata CBS 1993]CDK26508.1 unnamed protein product [Kuraishia capsulata CBS 1993]